MNADRINRWLTLCANLGVVIGLALLIFQLEQNNDLMRAQIHQSRTDAWIENRFARADSQFLLPAIEKFHEAGFPEDFSALDRLSPEDGARMDDMLQAFQADYDNLFYQYQHGYLDEEYYRYLIEPSIRYLAPWWRHIESTGRPSFEREVDRILAGPN